MKEIWYDLYLYCLVIAPGVLKFLLEFSRAKAVLFGWRWQCGCEVDALIGDHMSLHCVEGFVHCTSATTSDDFDARTFLGRLDRVYLQ